jgi:hypothetical protein
MCSEKTKMMDYYSAVMKAAQTTTVVTKAASLVEKMADEKVMVRMMDC